MAGIPVTRPDDKRLRPRIVDSHAPLCGGKQVTIRFDAEQFEAILETAQRRGTSFTDMVRCLCEWGLEQESERIENLETGFLKMREIALAKAKNESEVAAINEIAKEAFAKGREADG